MTAAIDIESRDERFEDCNQSLVGAVRTAGLNGSSPDTEGAVKQIGDQRFVVVSLSDVASKLAREARTVNWQ
ncbi:MAG TPA: hypothetical protein VER96_19825 [Polyangiaceae bacterium]|nr:hypothetical protein [Polyangiaceae bacterium]